MGRQPLRLNLTAARSSSQYTSRPTTWPRPARDIPPPLLRPRSDCVASEPSSRAVHRIAAVTRSVRLKSAHAIAVTFTSEGFILPVVPEDVPEQQEDDHQDDCDDRPDCDQQLASPADAFALHADSFLLILQRPSIGLQLLALKVADLFEQANNPVFVHSVAWRARVRRFPSPGCDHGR
jgi:hypothetical protein